MYIRKDALSARIVVRQDVDNMLKSGQIFIDNMRFHAHHGVLEQERLTGGDFLVSLSASYPLGKATESDDVTDTLNYAEVYEIVESEMDIPSKLLEHVAGRIGKRLLKTMPLISELTVRLTKVNPPMGADCDGAGVLLHFINDENC